MYYNHARLTLCFWENGFLYFSWKNNPDVILAASTAPLDENADILTQVYQLTRTNCYQLTDEEREALGRLMLEVQQTSKIVKL